MSDGIVIRAGDINSLAEAVEMQGRAISTMTETMRVMSEQLARQRDIISTLTNGGHHDDATA